MGAYTDIDHVGLVGAVLPAEIARVESAFPSFVAQNAESVSRLIDSLLVKRYAVPFVEPVPETVRFHCAQLVAQRIWRRHGDSPTNQAKTDAVNDFAKDALAYFREAADAQNGFVELPRREDQDGSAVTKGGPFVSSQQSPYAWQDDQADAGRQEDTR